MANADNLFIVQDGEYILQRKAPTAPYAIIANFEESFSNFRVVTSMKLDKALSESGFSGLMFMMQNEGQGGFLIEVNKINEYRIRQIVNGAYKYVTGSAKTNGWVKSNSVNDPGLSNMIEVRSMNRNYDLYLNNKFIQSFSEPGYRSGKMGLIVGPSTRTKIDFVYIFSMVSDEELTASVSQPAENVASAPSSSGPEVIELAESIIRLKTQINKLTEENEDLRKTISAMRSGEQEKDVTVKNYEKQVKALQDVVAKKEITIDSLIRKNNELQKFKELAGGNENGDLIILLSKNLKSEKEKNAVLEQELKELKENTAAEKSGAAKGTKNKTSQDGKDTIKNDPAIFKLPDEN